MSSPDAKLIIAAGIRGYIACELADFGYHEPARDTSLLSKVSDDADGIAEYILIGLRENGYAGWVRTNATRQPRAYTDADAEAWSDT